MRTWSPPSHLFGNMATAAGRHVFLAGFILVMICGPSLGQNLTLDVQPGGVMNLTFDLIDGAVPKLLVKYVPRPGNPVDAMIRLLRWSVWPAGSAPTQPEILDPALAGRVQRPYNDSDTKTVTIGIKNFQPNDTGPGVYYEFQQFQNKSPKKYFPNIIAPPPSVTALNVTVGENFANITWLQVEPLDNAPVWYHVEYGRKGDNWQWTARLNGTGGTDPLTMRVEGLQPAVWYQFRVVASNHFGDSYSPIKEALTKGTQKRPGLSGGAIAGIIVVAIFVGLCFIICLVGCLTKKINTHCLQACFNAIKRSVGCNGETAEDGPRPHDQQRQVPDQGEIALGDVRVDPRPQPDVVEQAMGKLYADIKVENIPFAAWDPDDPRNKERINRIERAVAAEFPPSGKPPKVKVVAVRQGSVIVTVLLKGLQKEMETIIGTLMQAVTGGKLAHIGVDPHYFKTYDHMPTPEETQQPLNDSDGHVAVLPPAILGQQSNGTPNDHSILEIQQHSEDRGGSSLRAEPVLTDPLDGSPDEVQPLMMNDSDIQTDAVPSSLLEKSFEYRVALYYDKDSENMKDILQIRRKLEEWEFMVYDLYRDGVGGKMTNYADSVKNCQHAIFCLPIKTKIDKYKFNVFLRNIIDPVEKEEIVPERNTVAISFHDDDEKNTADSVRHLLADTEVLPYGKADAWSWRKLYRKLAIPGSTLSAEEANNLLAGVPTSVEELAAKLNIPPDVVHDVGREFGNDAAAKRELVRLWKGSEGPQATREALLTAVSNKGTRMEPSSSEPSFTSEQPSSTVEYLLTDKTGASELDNIKDPPSLKDTKEQGCNGQMEHLKKSTDAMDDEELLRHVLSQSLEDYNTLEENRMRLEKHVSQSGLVFRDPVPEDGNCLFHAISDQLGRVGAQQLSHQDLRAMAVEYLRSNPLTTSGDHRKQWVPDEDWDGYLDTMAEDGEWGDHLVIIALADQLQRDIRIVSNVNSDEYDVITEPTSGRIESNAPILLGHYAGNHYVSLDIAPQATGSRTTTTPEDYGATSQPQIQGGEKQQSTASEVQDEIEEKSMSYDSPPQKDDEATPLLSQPPQPETKIMTKGLHPQMQVSQIPFSIRHKLTTQLSVKRADGRDWRLLAELLDYNEYIALWDQQQGLPAEKLLSCWEAKSEATVGGLKEILLEQNMGDIANVLDIE